MKQVKSQRCTCTAYSLVHLLLADERETRRMQVSVMAGIKARSNDLVISRSFESLHNVHLHVNVPEPGTRGLPLDLLISRSSNR